MRLDETLYTIFAYENSINRPEEERWTKTRPLEQFGNYIEWSGNPTEYTDTPLTLEEYADKCKNYLRFGKEVDEVLYGKYNLHEYLKICDTPQILLDAGFEQKPILYTQKHLRLAVEPKTFSNPHKHGLPIETIKKLPSLFESPVILADNPSREDAMLIVLCEVDKDKLPLIASIKPDASGNYQLEEIETNLILTVFGKDGKEAKNTILYHQILGFNPDECDINGGQLSPKDCMKYAQEYAQKYYPNHEIVFALHNEYCKEDTTHRYAVHMVINRSVLSILKSQRMSNLL